MWAALLLSSLDYTEVCKKYICMCVCGEGGEANTNEKAKQASDNS
jgi:hypothetical protein